ncbi:MAG: Lin1244/Lin1753 domain-containing protein [Clostridiaceae bacterium]
MGRPQKQTVDYFPHFANSGKTIFILENKFGNDGYAFWFKLLEILATTEGHYFRVENTIDWEFLLAKTKVSSETAIEILNTLANLDAIDQELWAKKIIWVQKFVDNLSEVYRKRKVSAPIKPNDGSFRDENPISEGVNDDINPQSKVKESKVKESKVESKESHIDEALKLCNEFEKLRPGQSIATHIDFLCEMIELYGYDWSEEALKRTLSNKNKFIKEYMYKILKNWKDEWKEERVNANSRDRTESPDREGIGLEF